jgi:hypothetical protein
MANANWHRENEDKGTAESPALALLANGSSGRWSVTLDESTEGTDEWFLQIEGPSLHLFCEVDDPHVLDNLATALNAPTKRRGPLVVGRVNRIPLRLQWDIEDEGTLFFTVGPASRPLVRCSIHG